ncbi:MAG: 3-hydroxyacyl-ACP dehydratase FabZ family protein [Planctomycetota bacterium]
MPASDLILDPATLTLDPPLVSLEEIRELIPQRGHIEQLTAIVHDDVEAGTVAGYKDLTEDEFWVAGHMPGLPLMPGVMMCEAAAQICSYFVAKHDLLGCEMLGFGGLDGVRFRGVVRPGDRLVVVAQKIAVRRGALIRCRFQCFVKASLVCEGELRGIPIPVDALREAAP